MDAILPIVAPGGLHGLCAVVVVVAAACFDPHVAPGGACAPGDLCPDGLHCVDGICLAGDAGAPMIDACPATACNGQFLVDCTGAHACTYGCAEAAAPHCVALVPSNGIATELLAGAVADLSGMELHFDTDTGAIDDGSNGVVRDPVVGVDAGIGFAVVDGMGVFTATTVTVADTATWAATGSNALVLFAADAIEIDGTLDAGGNDIVGGPGGGGGGVGGTTAMCAGGDGRYKTSLLAGAGGGGGGGATAGGDGAATAADAMGATSGGAGGATCARPSAMPLRGGNGGGAGGTENMIIQGGPGGGGGGAIALVAMTRVEISGTVGVPGEGGATDAGGSGGGGAGSGGAVLVESPVVVISGAVTANGGGGGAPANAGMIRVHGERGHLGDGVAAIGGFFNGKHGGFGGTGAVDPTAGQTDTGGGGGGGAAGAIHLRGTMTTTTGATFSPTPATSQAVMQ